MYYGFNTFKMNTLPEELILNVIDFLDLNDLKSNLVCSSSPHTNLSSSSELNNFIQSMKHNLLMNIRTIMLELKTNLGKEVSILLMVF